MELADQAYDVYDIPIHEIWVADDFNCRDAFTSESVVELAQSMEQEGLLFPIVVQPIEELDGAPQGYNWRLVCGFRRYSAARHLKWDTIPANVRVGMNERQAAMMNLTENLERKNLNLLEEAKALDRLFPVYRTNNSIASELNRSEKWVRIRRTLLTFPEWIQQAVASNRIRESDVLRIAASTDRERMAREIVRLNQTPGMKTRVLKKGRPPKKEIKEQIARLLNEGFNPNIVRLLGWSIGEVDDAGLEESLKWLRDRIGWLR